MEQVLWEMKSPMGKLYLGASAQGLQFLSWSRCVPAASADPSADDAPAVRILRQAVAELTGYFRGTRSIFTVPLDLSGTPFQRRVWECLRLIPYGTTCSYKAIAQLLGNPRAFRAVGMANKYNPVPIIVPCHRVIAADGTPGGYSAGLFRKRRLLALERKFLHEPGNPPSPDCGVAAAGK